MSMDLSDDNVLELLNWRPDAPAWRAEWMDLYEHAPADGWELPSPAWIAWARTILQHPVDMDGQIAIARILHVAETIHPQGLERPRLRDALLALGHVHGREYWPAEGLVDAASSSGVIRLERIERWHPGMRSGTGWRTFYRLTLHGKSLIKAAAMPDPFPPPEPPRPPAPFSPPRVNWLEMVRAATAKEQPVQQAVAADDSAAGAIGDDFVWAAPFVDQQVRKFFRKNWDEYALAVQAVVNDQTPMEHFSLDFGPKRISAWINEVLKVRADHPNPCSKQNINASATYEALVKAFKRNPREHAVVQRLQHGRSDEAQAILNDFLESAGPST